MSEDIFAQVYGKKKQLAAQQDVRKEVQKEREAWSKQNEENAKREAPPQPWANKKLRNALKVSNGCKDIHQKV